MKEIQNRSVLQNSLTTDYYLNLEEQKEILKKIQSNIILDLDSSVKLLELLSGLEDEKKIKDIIELIEQYEYEKMYTYSFIYNLKTSKEELIQQIERNKELFNTKSLDKFSREIEKPTCKKTKEKISIKFSKVLKNRIRVGHLKYPILVEFFLEDNFFQIKFEPLETEYQYEKKNTFLAIISEVEKWLKETLKINFEECDIFDKASDLIKEIKKDPQKYENISEFLDYGRDQFNGDMKLKANSKDKVPLFSELRNLIENFKCEEDKKILENFLERLDVTIERYKRGIEWSWVYGNSTKKSRVTLVFSKNYGESSKTLVHLYYNNQSLERRDYVIKYIAKYTQG